MKLSTSGVGPKRQKFCYRESKIGIQVEIFLTTFRQMNQLYCQWRQERDTRGTVVLISCTSLDMPGPNKYGREACTKRVLNKNHRRQVEVMRTPDLKRKKRMKELVTTTAALSCLDNFVPKCFFLQLIFSLFQILPCWLLILMQSISIPNLLGKHECAVTSFLRSSSSHLLLLFSTSAWPLIFNPPAFPEGGLSTSMRSATGDLGGVVLLLLELRLKRLEPLALPPSPPPPRRSPSGLWRRGERDLE